MNAAWNWFLAEAGRGAAFLFQWSWQAFVLLACVWLGLKIVRAQSPAIRCQVWLFGLMAVAAMPLWASIANFLPLPQPKIETLRYAAEAPAMVIAAKPEPATVNAATPAIQAAAKPSLLLPAIFALWLIGALITLARIIRCGFDLRRVRKNARPASLAELDCGDVSNARNVKIGLSAEVRSPVLAGVIRPAILLPDDIALWTAPAERRAMIEHELAHVERRDPLANLFQTALHVLFFFHPMVRFASRQLSLERETACDDRVVSLGAAVEAYAESILKSAERSLAPGGAHGLALISPKQLLERRIEMILNKDRVRVIARQWRYLFLSAVLIAAVAWLLIPAREAQTGLAQPQPDENHLKFKLVEALGEAKAFNDLIAMALTNPDPELRQYAAVQITESEGDGSTPAMVEAYNKSDDPVIKQMVIYALGRIGEIEPLTKIALSDPSSEFRKKALGIVKWLKQNSESADVRNWDAPGLQAELEKVPASAAPPLPPPPPPRPGHLTVAAGEPVKPLRWHKDDDSVFALLRQVADANIRRDTSFFERILDEEFIQIGPSGETWNKAQAIAEVKRLDYTFKKFEFDDLRVSGTEQTALATFLVTGYFEANGQDSTVQFRYTVNFIKRDGQLKIVAIHMSLKS